MEQRPVGGALDNTRTRRDHHAPPLGRRLERRRLAFAEGMFPLTRKNLRHGHAGDTGDFFVEVDKLPMKEHREKSASRGLPASRRTYEYHTPHTLCLHARIVAFPGPWRNYRAVSGRASGV